MMSAPAPSEGVVGQPVDRLDHFETSAGPGKGQAGAGREVVDDLQQRCAFVTLAWQVGIDLDTRGQVAATLRVRHRIHAVRDDAHLDAGAVEIAPRPHQIRAVDRVPFGGRRAGPRDRVVGQRDFIDDIEGREVVQRRCWNPGLNHSPAGVDDLDPRVELTQLRQRLLGCRVHVEVDLNIAVRVDTNQLILRLIRWRRRLRFRAVDERLTRDAAIRIRGWHL